MLIIFLSDAKDQSGPELIAPVLPGSVSPGPVSSGSVNIEQEKEILHFSTQKKAWVVTMVALNNG